MVLPVRSRCTCLCRLIQKHLLDLGCNCCSTVCTWAEVSFVQIHKPVPGHEHLVVGHIAIYFPQAHEVEVTDVFFWGSGNALVI